MLVTPRSVRDCETWYLSRRTSAEIYTGHSNLLGAWVDTRNFNKGSLCQLTALESYFPVISRSSRTNCQCITGPLALGLRQIFTFHFLCWKPVGLRSNKYSLSCGKNRTLRRLFWTSRHLLVTTRSTLWIFFLLRKRTDSDTNLRRCFWTSCVLRVAYGSMMVHNSSI